MQKNTEYAQLAVSLMNGKLGNDQDVLKDIFEALLELKKRNDRGVGKQNFTYGPSLLEFANIAMIISPQLYRVLAKTLGGTMPNERSIKYVDLSLI